MKECMHWGRAFIEVELSVSFQALPRGKRTSWMRQNHDLDQKQRKGSGSGWKTYLAAKEAFQTQKPEKNELPPDHWRSWPADCDWVTDFVLKMATQSLRHTEPTGSLKHDLVFQTHGDLLKSLKLPLHLNFTHYVGRVTIKKSDYIFGRLFQDYPIKFQRG